MKQYMKQAAFVLGVFAIACVVNKNVSIPVIGAYLPGGANT